MIKKLNNTLAILTKIKSPLKIIENVNLPNLKKNQVLVKIKDTAICGSQLFEIEGKRESKKYIPHALGHEATGVVIKKHKNIKKVKIKDKVFISWIKSRGKDAETPLYKFPRSNKKINCGKVATFGKYAILPENRVNKIPKLINFNEALLLGCAIPTGAGMVLNQSNLNKGDKILVLGIGGVGLSVLMTLKIFNNIKVYIYDQNYKNYNYIKKYFNNINYLNKNTFNQLSKNILKNNKIGFDYVFETTGNIKVLEGTINLIKNSGKVIFASHPEKNKFIKIDPFELIKGKKIEGSWGGQTNFEKNLEDYVKVIKKNKDLISKLTKVKFQFIDINKAIDYMLKGKIIRPIIKIN